MKPFLASSMVNLRVIRSSSFSWENFSLVSYDTQRLVQKETTHWVCVRVNLDAGFSTSKGNIHHCTLEGHQCGQSLHLIFCNIHAITNTWKSSTQSNLIITDATPTHLPCRGSCDGCVGTAKRQLLSYSHHPWKVFFLRIRWFYATFTQEFMSTCQACVNQRKCTIRKHITGVNW